MVQPGPCRQSAHAVANQGGRLACQRGGARHSVVDDRYVVVDRSEDRLQIDRHVGHAERLKPLHPGQPEPPVAEEAVHEHHRWHGCRRRRRGVGQLTPAERLAPGEDLRRHLHLLPPCAQPIGAAGSRRAIGAVDGRSGHRFNAQNHRVTEGQHDKNGQQSGPGGRPGPPHPHHVERKPAQHQHLLQPGKRRGLVVVIDGVVCRLGVHGQTMARVAAAHCRWPRVTPWCKQRG